MRHFLFELIFYDTSGYCVHVDWLMYIADVGRFDRYNWGDASYAYLLCRLDDVVRRNLRSYIGLYPLLTVSS